MLLPCCPDPSLECSRFVLGTPLSPPKRRCWWTIALSGRCRVLTAGSGTPLSAYTTLPTTTAMRCHWLAPSPSSRVTASKGRTCFSRMTLVFTIQPYFSRGCHGLDGWSTKNHETMVVVPQNTWERRSKCLGGGRCRGASQAYHRTRSRRPQPICTIDTGLL